METSAEHLASNISVSTSGIEAIFQASLIVQLTLLTLVSLSVVCWAIGFLKYRQFKILEVANEPFQYAFDKATSLDQLFENLPQFQNSSLAKVFEAAYEEMRQILKAQSAEAPTEGPLKLSGIDNLERVLRKSIDNEISKMESHLTVLATTGSTGPFIGLFGTVWGIMTSFHKIGQTGSASLAVVAPGISEALIATAIGLAAAIPAVVLYNHFIAKIKKQENGLNNFAADFLNIAKRNFFKE